MGNVLVVAEHLNGALADVTFEMLGHAKSLAGDLGGSCEALLIGGSAEMVGQLGAAAKVYTVDAPGDFNPESHLAAVVAAVQAASPRLVLIGSTSMGMDLASGLSVQAGLPLAAYALGISAAGGKLQCKRATGAL